MSTERTERDSVMVYVDGSRRSFRCTCGGNVFIELSEPCELGCDHVCNACGAHYKGTK